MDDASKFEDKKLRLQLFQKYIHDLFADRKSDFEVKSVPHEVNIDWAPYEAVFTGDEMACLRAFARMSFFFPRKPYEQLLEGYELDLANRPYKTEKDVLEYFTLVAGSYAVMVVFAFLYRYNIDKHDFVEKDDYVIKKAYQLGNVSNFLLTNLSFLIHLYSYFLRACSS